MRKKFIQYFPLGRFWNLKKLSQDLPLNCLFPLYHGVSDTPIPYINALYKHKSKAQFLDDLNYLLKYFEPVTLADCVAQIALGKPFKKPSFHLTFDDGLRSFYEVVAPILIKKNISATCFVNSQFIDNQDLMYRYKVGLMIDFMENNSSQNSTLKPVSYYNNLTHLELLEIDEAIKILSIDIDLFLKNERPYLTKPQMSELKNQGFTFGGHSVNHPHYQLISDQEKLKQTEESIAALDFLIQDFKAFAYPFTDAQISENMRTKIAEQVDISFGCAGIKPTNIDNHIQRLDFEIATLPASKIIKNDLIYQKLLSFIKK